MQEKKQNRLVSLATILNTIMINLLGLAVPIFTLQVYDRILIQANMSTLLVLSIVAFVAILLEAIFRIARNILINKTAKLYECNQFNKLINLLLHADRTSLEQYSTSKILDQFKTIPTVYDMYYQVIISQVDMLFMFLYLGVILYLSPILVIVPVFTISIFLICIVLLNKHFINYTNQRSEADHSKYDSITEILKSFSFIKANNLENNYLRKFEYYEKNSAIVNDKSSRLSLQIFNITSIIPQLNIIGMASIGAYEVIHNSITMGTLIAAIIIAGRLINPINQAVSLWLRRNEYKHALNKINTFAAIKRAVYRKCKQKSMHAGNLNIINLHFNHNRKKIIKGINLTLEKGQSISINAGKAHAKNALINLLTGSYVPTKGKILINDINASNIRNEDFMNHIGYLSFENAIVKGTIYENITCFEDIPEAKVYDACEKLGVHHKILNLPHGYHTPIVNVNNEIVFPGLKQQIALARVILKKPKIVIYNNADRHLDIASYNILYHFLAKLKPHIILIIFTNDRNIASLANKQCVIRKGLLIDEKDEHIVVTNDIADMLDFFGRKYG